MKKIYSYLLLGYITIFLQSCEFNCSVGNTNEPKGKAVVKNGTRTYNDITLQTQGVKVDKAYLVFKNDESVPDDNIIDFTKPVKLVLGIEKGWKEENNKVRKLVISPAVQIYLA